MSFQSLVIAFAGRFLSDRTFQLIVVPALADLQFECNGGRLKRFANQLAVLWAVAGGLRDDVTRNSGTFVALALLPACYYIFLFILWSDFFSASAGFFSVATVALFLSLGPVMVCFWPDRRTVRPVE